jgi:DNA-binding XRE family transcriptional regulator
VRKDDFATAQIDVPGLYRLVPDHLLEQLLADVSWISLLDLPKGGLQALAFTIRYFRERQGLSIQGLADAVGMSRNQLAQIEAAELKRGPHPETLSKMAKFLGEDFRAAVVAHGFEIYSGPSTHAS